MHEYLVDLRIVGDWEDEKPVSDVLGLKASLFTCKGEEQGKRILEKSVWQLDARPSPEKLEWSSLEDGLKCLIDMLMPVKTAIDQLKASCDVSIVCGHFNSSFGGGPTLSPEILESLARLGVKLTICSYFCDEDGNSAESKAEAH